MSLPSEYTRILAQHGRPMTDENPGTQEVGLNQDAVLDAIAALEGTLIAILGGDVLTDTGGVPKYGFGNWFSQKKEGENLEDFALRSRKESAEYIRRLRKPKDGRLLFVLVLSEK